MNDNDRVSFWVYRMAVISALAGAIFYFSAILYITLSRIHYPFSLEWSEGAMLVQVQRILTGKLLYDRPSYEYIALNCPPFYYYASAFFVHMLGPGFFPLRLVSFISSLGSTLTIYLICRKEGVRIIAAVIASGLFAATYRLGGAWFDIARVDMLALFFVLTSFYLLRFQSVVASMFAGVAFTMACLTKQSYIICWFFPGLYLLLFEQKKAFFFLTTSVLLFAASSLYLYRIFAGWYTFFVFTISIGRGTALTLTPATIIQSIPDYLGTKIVLPLIVVVALIAMYIYMQIRQTEDLKRFAFYLFCSIGMVGVSWASTIHLGAYDNNLIPAYAIFALLFGLSLEKLCFGREINTAYRSTLLFACTAQFIMLHFPIETQIPTIQDLHAGQVLVAEIEAQTGDVFVPFHPELGLIAGKSTFANWNAMYLLEGGYGGGDLGQAQIVKAEFLHAMATNRFSMIILDKDLNWVWGYPERHYSISTDPIFRNPTVFWPVMGWQVRPTIKMLPNSP